MSSTVIDVIDVLIAHGAAFWNWASTGSSGFPPL